MIDGNNYDSIDIINVEIVASRSVKTNWRGFIQKITTNFGVLYDNCYQETFEWRPKTLGFDWSPCKGKSISLKKTNGVEIVIDSGIFWMKNTLNKNSEELINHDD
jgi:hypothetical protein